MHHNNCAGDAGLALNMVSCPYCPDRCAPMQLAMAVRGAVVGASAEFAGAAIIWAGAALPLLLVSLSLPCVACCRHSDSGRRGCRYSLVLRPLSLVYVIVAGRCSRDCHSCSNVAGAAAIVSWSHWTCSWWSRRCISCRCRCCWRCCCCTRWHYHSHCCSLHNCWIVVAI